MSANRRPMSALRVLRTFFTRKGLYPIDIYHVSSYRWVHVHMIDNYGSQYTDQFTRHALRQMLKFNKSLDKTADTTNLF